jgi:hypothetical protein
LEKFGMGDHVVCETGSSGEGKSRLLLGNLAETDGLLQLFAKRFLRLDSLNIGKYQLWSQSRKF